MADMRELEAFLTVAQEMHFGRAAERLGLSTSRVSFLVKRLERRVRAQLFQRTSRRVALTAEGEYLVREIRPAWTQIERALADVSVRMGNRVEVVRVGFGNTLPAHLAGELAAAFERSRPGCQVIQSTLPTTEVLRWLGRDWMVDVMVTWMPEDAVQRGIPGMELGPVIWRQPRAVALAATHPLAGRTAIDIEELADHEVLHFVELPQAWANGWTPQATPTGRPMRLRPMSASYVEECFHTVLKDNVAHLTFTSLPDRYQLPGVAVIPLTGLPPLIVTPLWPDTPTRHRLAPAFAQTALTHATQAGWPRDCRP